MIFFRKNYIAWPLENEKEVCHSCQLPFRCRGPSDFICFHPYAQRLLLACGPAFASSKRAGSFTVLHGVLHLKDEQMHPVTDHDYVWK